MGMTDKTDAEFIAECEAHDQEMLDRWFCGDSTLTTDMGLDFGFTRAALTEAIERLKRARQPTLLMCDECKTELVYGKGCDCGRWTSIPAKLLKNGVEWKAAS